MIISPKHKYVFIENPRTACTAIASELQQFYGGEAILFKHATYRHFVEWAGRSNARKYFVIAGVRNPLDDVVSEYFKLRTNHKADVTNPAAHRKNGGWITDQKLSEFEFIQRHEASFAAYFREFYKHSYVNRSVLARRHIDFTIRFEHVQEDFSEVLQLLKLDQIRPLPVVNRTEKPSRDYRPLYEPSIRPQAIRVLGPLMAFLGYTFPDEWYAPKVTPAQWAQFYSMYAAKMLYWRFGAFRKERVKAKTYESVALASDAVV